MIGPEPPEDDEYIEPDEYPMPLDGDDDDGADESTE
jgi:hypothetical protein